MDNSILNQTSANLAARIQANLSSTVSAGQLVITPLPLCPAVRLYLISPDYPRGRLDEAELQAILRDPAYWAFCWASGQVLARYILDHPDLFSGKTVLDFGTGSGVVAIAAALAGAGRVIACDIDPMALDASRANAELNGVQLELLADVNELAVPVDIVIAADVLYDRDNIPWLDRLPNMGDEVLIADSRFKHVELHGYQIVERITATTVPDLDELQEFSRVKVYRSVR